jgi:ketosteroid isomerase-like protein
MARRLLVPILLLVAAVAGAQQSLSIVRTQMERLYAMAATAFEKQDVKAIKDRMHPDYRYTDRSGKVTTLRDVEQMMRAQFAAMTDQKVKYEIKSVRRDGQAVITRVEFHFTGKTRGGKPDTIESKGISDDTWVKDGDRWLLRSVKLVEERTLVNGKPAR